MMLDDYILTKLLGKGTFGEVFLTTKKNSNLSYATKRMERDLAEHPQYCKYFVNEVSILRNVYHKNIVKIIDLKKTKNHYYIIMELCNGGSLKDNLEKYMKIHNKPFPEKIVQHVMRQIVSAINYLHGLKIVHRDLKLDNILVNYSSEEDKNNINLLNAEVKIVDFGFATHISNVSLLTSAVGSPFNMDPRILKKYSSHAKCPQGYDEKADIWSLGTLCYHLLIGENAFIANTVQELSSKIEEGNFKIPITLARETISFLMDMLQYDSNKRSSASEISSHPFLIKYIGDFTYIDLRKVFHKINYDKLYLNIKDNKTICSVVNEEGVKQLNLSPTDLFPVETGSNYFNLKSTGLNSNSINFLDSRGLSPINNNDFMESKQNINKSTPILNNTNMKKDPVLNQLLNIQAPQKQKEILNSLIYINENSITTKMSKSIQPNNNNQFYQNNTIEMNNQNQIRINDNISKSKPVINPSGTNKTNQFINQRIQITPQKYLQNNITPSGSKNTPIQKNKINNPVYNNQLNRSEEANKTISSKNLGEMQFRDFQNKFNILQPINTSNQNNSGMNRIYDYKKMSSSDNKNIPNVNINNSWQNKQYPGTVIQPTSSKNVNPKALNFMNFQ
jgi:serine/threonine protein kinase